MPTGKEKIMNNKNGHQRIKNMVGTAILTAIVIVVQLLGLGIRIGPFSAALVLVPIVIGAALYGIGAGAWLGFVFGFVVLVSDPTAHFLLTVNVFGTILTVLVRGLLAGMAAGIAYRCLCKKTELGAVVLSAVVCPLVNTGLFLLGCSAFFTPQLAEWAAGGGYENAVQYIVKGIVLVLFIPELLLDILLSPVILRLVGIGKKAWTKD